MLVCVAAPVRQINVGAAVFLRCLNCAMLRDWEYAQWRYKRCAAPDSQVAYPILHRSDRARLYCEYSLPPKAFAQLKNCHLKSLNHLLIAFSGWPVAVGAVAQFSTLGAIR